MKNPMEEHSKKPKSYFLTEKDFAKAPETLSTYKIGEPVTRDNFVSFLIQSFAISRGKLAIQLLFMRWLKRKYGFDYQKTLKNFAERGGVDSFSGDEQKMFDTAYDSVERHKEYEQQTTTDFSDPKSRKLEFKLNFNALCSEKVDATQMKEAEHFFDLEKIDTFADFTAAAKKYFEENPLKSIDEIE